MQNAECKMQNEVIGVSIYLLSKTYEPKTYNLKPTT